MTIECNRGVNMFLDSFSEVELRNEESLVSWRHGFKFSVHKTEFHPLKVPEDGSRTEKSPMTKNDRENDAFFVKRLRKRHDFSSKDRSKITFYS